MVDSNDGSKNRSPVQAAEPRLAATVVLLRPGAQGLEVLMVRRNRGSSFMADAYVFPGGRVEPGDGDGEAAFAAAAARELAEEAGLTVAPASLVPFARWITPSFEPKRFDTRFFLAAAPPDQTARHDTVEAVDHLWATATDLLQRQQRGELKLPPPTIRTLEDVADFAEVEQALSWARTRPLTPIMPKIAPSGESVAIVMPWDDEYSSLPGEGLPLSASDAVARPPSRLLLQQGRWWGKPPG